jgi:GT2 family glycosyltransferase
MLFDIIVPTYNRYSLLPLFFKKLEPLDREQYTLWLIDDASPLIDESIIPVWHNIRFIKLSQNIGQAGARNVAIEKGDAPYLISLDDDAWFETADHIFEDITKGFHDYSDAGCLMFNIATPNTNYKPPKNGIELPLHVTCGCAYRREAIVKIGGFSSILQGQVEETDISIRLIKEGYKIKSYYSVKVFHDFDPSTRSLQWYLNIRFKNTRNDLAVVYMNYPFPQVILHLFGKALSHLKFSVTYRKSIIFAFVTTIKGVLAFLIWLPKLRRKPMKVAEFGYWRSLINKE